MLETKFRKLLYHYFINKRQSEAYNSCKVLATSESSDTAMVQMYFSENFSFIYHEVSSTHWKTRSVTLYTVMIWFRVHKISTALFSDSSIHDKTTIVPYTLTVLDYIWETWHWHKTSWGLDWWKKQSIRKQKQSVHFCLHWNSNSNEVWIQSNMELLSRKPWEGAVGGIRGLIKGFAMTSLVTKQAIIKDTTCCHLRWICNRYIKESRNEITGILQEFWQEQFISIALS